MRKSPTDPRRLYTRSGITHVLFNANTFAMPEESSINEEDEVLCEPARPYRGMPRLKVTQLTAEGTVTETWKAVEIPRGASRPRKAKAAAEVVPVAEEPTALAAMATVLDLTT